MEDELIPQIIKDVGFDFNWSEEKVWALDIPPEEMDIFELTWHFNIPFWDENGQKYCLYPLDVINHPNLHQEEYKRTMNSDISYPIDIMENKGKWLILDGLHRLVKCKILGKKKVIVRKIPRERIPEITP